MDKIDIEIDGKMVQVDPGSMIIEAADEAGIVIPRFCYHKKLSIAANCRMCLVDVEKARKPLPACATPVTSGMIVRTKSQLAREAQKSVMEFLLINHPLDCPICDQGGECELQDVAMGYGDDVSRFTEGKRSVKDKDIGPLVSTDMTRCIHCTRCIRFGEEVAGLRELGATGRGEHMEVGTYVAKSVKSELSGNIIDLCPVGALTSKPFRFSARAWELQQRNSIAVHDCVGSNTQLHIRRNEVMRVVPQENEAINETWLSDRDRFSYVGLNSDDRLTQPMIRQKDQWIEVDWPTAFVAMKDALTACIEQHGPEQVAAIASPNSTVEEFYLLQKVLRGLGSNNVDHRLRQKNFDDQDEVGAYPGLECNLSELAHMDSILLLGSNIHHEQPILGHRVRKAARRGAQVLALNPLKFNYHFPLAAESVVPPAELCDRLAGIAKALMETQQAPEDAKKLLANTVVSETDKVMAQHLLQAERAIILLGTLAQHHSHAATIRRLSRLICQMANVDLGWLTDGANAQGAWLAGAIPHRGPANSSLTAQGVTAHDAFEKALKAYVLMNVEPNLDCADGRQARHALTSADMVIALSTFKDPLLMEMAHILLPITPYSETAGTYVNVMGEWQTARAVVTPQGEARPGWKVLRVMGNMFNLPGFEYTSQSSVLAELKEQLDNASSSGGLQWVCPESLPNADKGYLERITQWPLYRVDPLVRRSQPLQETTLQDAVGIYMHSDQAAKLNLKAGDVAHIEQQGTATLNVFIDERVPLGSVYVPAGYLETADLSGGSIVVRRDK